MTQIEEMNTVIREATGEDLDRLSLIASATFMETFAGEIAGDALIGHCNVQHRPDYLAKLLAAGARAWLAELDGTPIGYALLNEPELEAAREGDIELKKIYVLSRFHGTGLAPRLFDAALAGAQGRERLLLGVKEDNDRAIAFYAKVGFVPIAKRQFNVGGKLYDDTVFAKNLAETGMAG